MTTVQASRAPSQVTRDTQRVAEWRAGRATIDRGLFNRQYNAVKINDLSSLWPSSAFRAEAMRLAKRWVADEEKLGRRLVTPEASILVYGPYQSRDHASMIANTTRGMRAVGYSQGEDPFPDRADVVFRAEFLVSYATANGRQELE